MEWAILSIQVICFFIGGANAQSSSTTVYYTTSGTTTSSYYGATPSSTTLYTSITTSTAWPLPTNVPYTGQSLLVGTCLIPAYTMLHFPDGNSLEVPLIGCSDDRPDCCPGIVDSPRAGSGSDESQSTSASGVTISALLPTGVVSALSENPLSVCPSDMIDLDPVCCPIGYKRYGESIIGNLPCVSAITSSSLVVPPSVLASISSAVASSILAETSSSSTSVVPTVTVVVNQVFALGLPCADQPSSHSALSTGAKAGIGAGVGVAALLFIVFLIWFIRRHRKHKQEAKAEAERTTAAAAEAAVAKHISTSTAATTMYPGSPMSHQAATFQQQQGMYPPHQPGMYPMPGFLQQHGFAPPFGYQQQPGHHDGIHPQYGYPPHMYPGQGSYSSHPGSGPNSPPPPFHEPQKLVEADGGGVVRRVPVASPRKVSSGVLEMSGSEREATTGGGGSSGGGGGGWESSTTATR